MEVINDYVVMWSTTLALVFFLMVFGVNLGRVFGVGARILKQIRGGRES